MRSMDNLIFPLKLQQEIPVLTQKRAIAKPALVSSKLLSVWCASPAKEKQPLHRLLSLLNCSCQLNTAGLRPCLSHFRKFTCKAVGQAEWVRETE